MKKKGLLLFLLILILSSIAMLAETKTGPFDFLGRVHLANGIEVESLEFMNTTTIYAATNGDGLYVSYDIGTNWSKVENYPLFANQMTDLIITDDGVIYTSATNAGVFKSDDNGVTWDTLNAGLTNLKIQALTRMSNGWLLVGTYGSGVFLSIDDGLHWERTDSGFRYDNVTNIEVLGNDWIIAATNGGGFYSSRDSAKTWRKANTGLPNSFINDLALNDTKTKIFAATNGDGVYFTVDGITWMSYGNSWHKEYDPDVQALPDTSISAIGMNGDQLLMGTRHAGMYYWDDLWNAWASTGPRAVGITAIASNGDGSIVATRSFGEVIRSTDDGENWEYATQQLVSEAGDLQYTFASPFGESVITAYWNSADSTADLYRSDDRGYSWEYLLTIDEIVASVTIDFVDPINTIAMSPDSCVFLGTGSKILSSYDNGKTFSHVYETSETSIGNIVYDPIHRRVLATSMLVVEAAPPSTAPPTITTQLHISTNNGMSWNVAQDFGTDVVYNLKYDYDTDEISYLIGQTVYKSIDGGLNFFEYGALPAWFSGLSIFHNGYNSNCYFAAGVVGGDSLRFRHIYESDDNGAHFTEVPFDPSNDFPPNAPESTNGWTITSIGNDAFGGIYAQMSISIPSVGRKYFLYYKERDSLDWLNISACYNMDEINNYSFDNDGYCYISTNALYKHIAKDKLFPPDIISPGGKQNGVSANPIMKWNSAEFAEEYELQIAQTQYFNSPFETNCTSDTICKIILDLFPDTDFYWRIRSKTHSTRSKWNVERFKSGLEAPILVSPEDKELGVPLFAELTWHQQSAQAVYSIEVATDELFTDIVFSADNHTDTSITTTQLDGISYYYWRVKSFTGDNESMWCEPWTFKTVMGPPILKSPEDGAENLVLSPELEWHGVEVATEYYIEVAMDKEFTDIIHFFDMDTLNADTTYQVPEILTPETKYFWRVASENKEGRSEFSFPWSFTTILPPVDLLIPADSSVNIALDSLLRWEEHLSGQNYQLQISTTPDFEELDIIEDVDVTNSFEYLPTALEVYSHYFWRARVIIDEENFGLWSEIWTFKTGINTATLISPEHKDSTVNFANTSFKWDKIEGAEFYQLQISQNEEFTQLIFSKDSIRTTSYQVTQMLPVTQLYWRVKAWNTESKYQPQWSERRSFYTVDAVVNLHIPKDDVDNVKTPTNLMWYSSPSEIYNFHLQIATDSEFEEMVYEKDSIPTNKFRISHSVIPNLKVQTRYYWRVRCNVLSYTSEFSDTWSFIIATVSVKDIAETINIYPQPADSYLELKIEGLSSSITDYSIIDINGNLLLNEDIHLSQGSHHVQINTAELSSGKYFLLLNSDKGVLRKEFVIVR